MNSPTPSLPQLAAIFRGIKAGRHWCFGDQEYDDLNSDLFDRYQAFFAQLELNLHRDGRGFIFATSDDDDHKGSDQITCFVVFTAVWVDAAADAGEDIGKSLFAPNQVVGDLPHLRADAHRRSLAQVGILSVADLHSTLRKMERLGLVEMNGQDRFSLRTAFNRLLDVCLAAGKKSEAPAEQPEPVSQEMEPSSEAKV
jgi:hypothetical protein